LIPPFTRDTLFTEMSVAILVVTPSPSFGESVRQTLENTDAYRVHVVKDKAGALELADDEACPLALLDLALGEEWVLEIGAALRSSHPEMDLGILCGDETPPSLDAIRPWTLIRKPLRTEELMLTFNPFQDKYTRISSPTGISPDRAPAWLGDVTKAAQHLTRLTLESSAQAALITRKKDLWAYAGGLPQSAAQEIAQAVVRYWDTQKGSDLLRFIRLESTHAEHMLYATSLTADNVLALVFDAETPFGTIRSQASQLITSLGSDTSSPAPQGAAPQTDLRSSFEFNLDEGEEDGTKIPPISGIITDVPAPNPTASTAGESPTVSQEPATSDKGVDAQGIKWPRRKQAGEPSITKPLQSGETRMSEPLSNAAVFTREDSTATRQDKVDVSGPSVAHPAVSGEMDATRISPTTEAARKIALEPVTAGMYHLTYACLLIPRFASHYLTGDLADKVAEWLPNICVSFGWRLEYMAVRPEYLQWVVNVQPNSSPGFVMRTMREQTNEKIFRDFGRVKKDNPSGDFWAPGYLIMGGSQPHPPQLVRDYIRQIRQRQGMEARR
jgi:REP element-mobilizing transposase RayT